MYFYKWSWYLEIIKMYATIIIRDDEEPEDTVCDSM